MIESLFIVLILIAFILMIFAISEKSIIFSVLDAILWLFLMVNSLYVEVPFSVADNTYTEYAFSGLCIAFVMIDIVYAVVQFMDFKRKSRMP